MAVTDNTSTHYDAVGSDRSFTNRFRISFATDNLASGDYLIFWAIPADTHVNWVAVDTITGETGTLDIGDFSAITTPTAVDADGWVKTMDIGTTGNVGDMHGWADAATAGADSTAAAAAYSVTGGKTYFTAAYMGLRALAALDSGVIDVYVNFDRFGTFL